MPYHFMYICSMCLRCLSILVFMLVFSMPIFAQSYNQQQNFLKANGVWAFGRKAGLDFNTGSPVPFPTAINSSQSAASVADSNGQLLFYFGSDGTIWNRDHLPMLNGTGLYPANPNSSSAQGALIVPVIDTPWKYYAFTNTELEGYKMSVSPPYLSYSVVDMRLDNGMGGVEPNRKNVPLYNYSLLESMIAIPGDNCDIWLVAVTAVYPLIAADPDVPSEGQAFAAWRISKDGIDTVPVYSVPTPALNEHEINLGGGGMSVSPDRKNIALAIGEGVLLCKFNPADGKASDGLILPGSRSHGNCFSPDNTKLYASSGRNILQFDIATHTLAAIMSSRYIAGSGFASSYYTLKLYKGAIYALYVGQSIHKINNPNGANAACDFEPDAIFMPLGMGINWSLPNEVVFPFVKNNATSTTHDTICFSAKSGYDTKMLNAPEGFSFYEWDNGSTENKREIASPGTYWVKYYNTTCMVYIDTFIIAATNLAFSLGDDYTEIFCDHPQSYLGLNVNIPDERISYNWQDGSTANNFKVTKSGTYWVEISYGGCVASDTINIGAVALDLGPDYELCKGDPIDLQLSLPPNIPERTIIQWSNGSSESSLHVEDEGVYWLNLISPPCMLTDTVTVNVETCECTLGLANAFSPNDDGINDVFLPVIEAGCLVNKYMLNIYNRFGERVFHSRDSHAGWNGLHRGVMSEVGTYFYELYFLGGTRQIPYYRKGDVILLR